MFIHFIVGVVSFLFSTLSFSNPYPIEEAVPKDVPGFLESEFFSAKGTSKGNEPGLEVLRVQLDWDVASDSFSLGAVVREFSGTQASVRSARHEDPLGSYKAVLIDAETKLPMFYRSIGTGREYRKLTRALTFRFPMIQKPAVLQLIAEHPETGEMQLVLTTPIDPANAQTLPSIPVEIQSVRAAKGSEKLVLNVYAEGYSADRKGVFFRKAKTVASALENSRFPGLDTFEINAVFSPSATRLGPAKDLGNPIPERDSFLGLYFPYWDPFGRWYHIVYPTREMRFRNGLAQAAYDYAVALVDDGAYWGVGNFNELTAIPAESSSFTYLLLHEIGHFFGLNEEYNGGGRTELEFAPGISEPWSQNITFAKTFERLKWNSFVDFSTPIPTPHDFWEKTQSQNPFGAYEGGYADSEPLHQTHKPGLSCVMEAGPKFCPVCRKAIEDRVKFDLGKP